MENNNNQFGNGTDSFISFQDYSPINRSGGAGQAQINVETSNQQQFGVNNMTNDPMSIGMMEDLRGLPEKKEEAQVEKGFWTLDYYKKFFNVNTNDVIQRLKGSMLPHNPDNYLLSQIRPNPDLYGPFWVCVTLVFSIAISGNIANYWQTAGSKNYQWTYNFHLVSGAATTICLYVCLVPLGLWSALKWSSPPSDTSMDVELIESAPKLGLLELLCLYGYSLTIYIPVAFLWTIPNDWFQWILVGLAFSLSGGVLIRSLFPIITGKQKSIYVAAILGMHFLLAAGFMLYFFHVPKLEKSDYLVATTTTTTTTIKSTIAPIVTEATAKSVEIIKNITKTV
ncbi:protein YIPF1 isoform X2 [Aphidius gifuensis]|uniref:protein YIPF1 isoform X2 n=1 Tax=Aphidius gifuensis TaxID=684658 RepID=UPI001CDC49F6|nr:protein YIPF1 isoform X2 [Aphidius gifuensis]